MTVSKEKSVQDIAAECKLASAKLAGLSGSERDLVLAEIANEINHHAVSILEANRKDIDEAEHLIKRGELSDAALKRLKLDNAKIDDIVSGIKQVAGQADPIGLVTLERELDDGLLLLRVSCPIGVVAVIFESRPDALPQIVSLCLKSGNAVILKGGKEAEHSNEAIFDCVQRALKKVALPESAVAMVQTREHVSELLKAEGLIDLIVPRGSNSLVKHIQNNTRIPVLGHADGVCHLYVESDANLKNAVEIAVDGKAQYPAACNAIETLLVHEAIAESYLPDAATALHSSGVELRCDEASMSILKKAQSTSHKDSLSQARIVPADDTDWLTEYGDLIIAVKVVKDLDEAIKHINRFGSHHTETIVTESKEKFERFFKEVDSAGIFLNASTRFADGFRYGFGAEVGISTGKLHPRGPVGAEGMVSYKYKLIGAGHIVADYVGEKGKKFKHKTITIKE